MTLLRDRLAAAAIEGVITGVSAAARLHPRARRQWQALDVVQDVPYQPTGERAHLLDIYRPTSCSGPWSRATAVCAPHAASATAS